MFLCTGDVLASSEDYRWMGPTRYDISGVKTIVNLKSYRGRIQFKEGNTTGTPQDTEPCKHGFVSDLYFSLFVGYSELCRLRWTCQDSVLFSDILSQR